MEAKEWTVHIFIAEGDGDDRTSARAVLYAGGDKRHESTGYARRNPTDRPVPEIGDELAAGRALMDLADKLMGDAAEDVAHAGGPAASR
ncbi:DUF1876 domain-containing protein [Microtetraspora sp. NBRC 13810]|uniref:DUF1876 domain-containing protein n=1 Tax=Microtetraspora sp. NBRC 13810 TaxID=3030990 RepID=UPI00255399E1|nr:DUF1876 domain-containing protein [Microtetraspora sp. NBRC 13810]